MKARVLACLVAALPVFGAACVGQPERTFFEDPRDGSSDATLEIDVETNDATTVTSPDGEVESGTAGEDGQPLDDMDGGVPDADSAPVIADAATDAPGAAAEAGCGPLDTLTHCGSCANTCNTANSVDAGCGVTGCTYACEPGWSDCNTADANTGGCTCKTPMCCGASCETTHSNGVGQSFYDCNPVGTFSYVTAHEACAAYTGDPTPANCKTFGCQGEPSSWAVVCSNEVGGNASACVCWEYVGGQIGKFDTSCECPSVSDGTWQ